MNTIYNAHLNILAAAQELYHSKTNMEAYISIMDVVAYETYVDVPHLSVQNNILSKTILRPRAFIHATLKKKNITYSTTT